MFVVERQRFSSRACTPFALDRITWFYARRYESLDPDLLPRLWLVFAAEPSDSGAVHSDVRLRWQRGDPDVAAAVAAFADIAHAGR